MSHTDEIRLLPGMTLFIIGAALPILFEFGKNVRFAEQMVLLAVP